MKETLNELRELQDQYFERFLKEFPFLNKSGNIIPCDSNSLFDLVIRAQVLVSILGETARKRLNHIGFDMLYPVDNSVDWYLWAVDVQENETSHTIYCSIAMRIDSELSRMAHFIEKTKWDEYQKLPSDEFLVSKSMYLSEPQGIENSEKETSQVTHGTQEINFNIENMHEKEAIATIEKVHKSSSISSNILNSISKASKLIGFPL